MHYDSICLMQKTTKGNAMSNWTQLDWDLDDAQTALNAAKTAKHKDENKDAIVHLENVIYSAKEAIARLKELTA